jgi:hypothetical protein
MALAFEETMSRLRVAFGTEGCPVSTAVTVAMHWNDPLLELHDPEAGLFLFLAPFHAFRQLDVTRLHRILLLTKLRSACSNTPVLERWPASNSG